MVNSKNQFTIYLVLNFSSNSFNISYFSKKKKKKLKVVVKVGLLHLLKPRSHIHRNIILLLQFLFPSSTQSSSTIFHSHFVKSSQFFQILFINWYMFWCQNGRPLNLKWAKALIVAPMWCFGHYWSSMGRPGIGFWFQTLSH